MGRPTRLVTIGPEGRRDAGKVFRLTLQPRPQLKRFMERLTVALQRDGIHLGQEVAEAAHRVVAAQGAVSASFADMQGLLDEMMACVRIVPDPRHPVVSRKLADDDIQELRTRLHLRMEWMRLLGDAAKP
jgi:hypothetical protein